MKRTATSRKGEATRQAILTRALALATQVGFEGLTIGRLADDLHLSKSGLFAHFRAKENLQVQVLEMAAQRFQELVVQPAFAAPRGEPRVRALFTHWLAWDASPDLPGGCPFAAAAFELDGRPGPARDYLACSEKDWLELIANTAATAVREGHFRADLDCEQLAYELEGIILSYHFVSRLLHDPKAHSRAEIAVEALLARARPASATSAEPAAKATRRTSRR
jgi:AcrR family transcriptional regulator